MATYHPSRKISKLNEPDTRETAGEATYSCGPLHMDGQRQDNQQEPIYNNSVLIQDVALKTYRERWMIETGGERGSGRSMLAAWHDNDDEWCVNLSKKWSILFRSSAQYGFLLISLHPQADIKRKKNYRKLRRMFDLTYNSTSLFLTQNSGWDEYLLYRSIAQTHSWLLWCSSSWWQLTSS